MKAFAFVFVAACGLVSAGAPEGKAVFETKCQPCHGPKGEGKAAIAKMYGIEMRHFGSKEVQSRSDAEIKQIITTGKGKMKPIAGLAEKQVEDVIAYVRTLKE
jgi:mono/diheme cytochrome c family protein